MTRKTTWSNSDSLVVGFGPNSSERKAGGVVKTEGFTKQATLDFDWETPTTAAPYGIVIPAGSVIKKMYIQTKTVWTGASLELDIGIIGGDVDGFFDGVNEDADAAGLGVADQILVPTIGVLLLGSESDESVEYPVGASDIRVGITVIAAGTAGTARLVVEYV